MLEYFSFLFYEITMKMKTVFSSAVQRELKCGASATRTEFPNFVQKLLGLFFAIVVKWDFSERTKQMEQILNFQVPAEEPIWPIELVILLHTQY